MISAIMTMSIAFLAWSDNPGMTRIESQWQTLIASTAGQPFGEVVLDVAEVFVGSPYEGGSLDRSDREELVVYLNGFDCVTLVENCLALARTLRLNDPRLEIFPVELERIRYRDGRIRGYCSRLHYTSDWGYDNQKKGVLVDITKRIGGIKLEKPLHFMTRHRQAYRQLTHAAHWEEMKKIEDRINKRSLYYIPKDRVAAIESRIENGDILALTSTVEGLDIAHVGIAIQKDRLYLLHASTGSKRVLVTEEPLAEYLAKRKQQSGIIVFRPLAPNTPEAAK